MHDMYNRVISMPNYNVSIARELNDKIIAEVSSRKTIGEDITPEQIIRESVVKRYEK